jgi:8-oxo-dGTP pyrophosphatase MutT (NUDIX family)
MADSSSPAEWRRGADRELLHTRIFDVRASEFQHPARSEPREFIIIDPPDWAVVLVLTPTRELVLVRQFRFGAESLSLELPGGVIEKGESPLLAAARETAEETGFRGAGEPKPFLQ